MGEWDSRRSAHRARLLDPLRLLRLRFRIDRPCNNSKSHQRNHCLLVGPAANECNPICRREWRCSGGPGQLGRGLDAGSGNSQREPESELQGINQSGAPVPTCDRAQVANWSHLYAASDGVSAAMFVLCIRFRGDTLSRSAGSDFVCKSKRIQGP